VLYSRLKHLGAAFPSQTEHLQTAVHVDIRVGSLLGLSSESDQDLQVRHGL